MHLNYILYCWKSQIIRGFWCYLRRNLYVISKRELNPRLLSSASDVKVSEKLNDIVARHYQTIFFNHSLASEKHLNRTKKEENRWWGRRRSREWRLKRVRRPVAATVVIVIILKKTTFIKIKVRKHKHRELRLRKTALRSLRENLARDAYITHQLAKPIPVILYASVLPVRFLEVLKISLFFFFFKDLF